MQIWYFDGVISRKSVAFNSFGHGLSILTTEGESELPIMSSDKLQEKYSLKFDTLAADCEGCICQFVEENEMSQFKIILLEKDQCDTCDYEKVEQHLSNLGFLRICNKWNYVYRTVHINVNGLPFKILNQQVANGNIGAFGELGYISEEEVNVVLNEKGILTLSAHAPSKITIENKGFLSVRGYCSPTSKIPPTMVFSVITMLLES